MFELGSSTLVDDDDFEMATEIAPYSSSTYTMIDDSLADSNTQQAVSYHDVRSFVFLYFFSIYLR